MKTDPLHDHLQREALAERPPFSEERHQQLLTHLRAPKPIPTTWFPRAAAAALIVTATLITAYSLTRSTSPAPIAITTPTPLAPSPIASSAPEIPQVTVNFANILSVNVWPPSITTTPAPQPDTNTSPPPTAVDRLVDLLQQPPASANAALADLIPPNLRNLFTESRPQPNDSILR